MNQDTQPFYEQGRKLGLGSSAALVVALTVSLAKITGNPGSLGQALTAHYNSQNRRGSGADVAASFMGGSVRFQNQAATTHQLPEGLHIAFIWTGTSTSTTAKIGSFDEWRHGPHAEPNLLDEMTDASQKCFETTDLLPALRNFCAIARRLDASAELGIYASAHEQLAGLASQKEILYKPCGAGGGDVGVAIATDPDALRAFTTQAKANKFAVLAMEIAKNGVQTQS